VLDRGILSRCRASTMLERCVSSDEIIDV
jgi:hypothetical protein